MIPLSVQRAHSRAVRDYADEIRRYADDAEAMLLAASGDPTLTAQWFADMTATIQAEIREAQGHCAELLHTRRELRELTAFHRAHAPVSLLPDDLPWPFNPTR